MWLALSLSVVAVAYNNIVNRWDPFHGSAYVPVNVAFACAVASLAAIVGEVSWTAFGVRGDIGDATISLAVVAVFALGAFAFARSRNGHRIADRRVRHLQGGALAFYVLVRIPLGTALVEEVVFRGVLYATWREAGVSPLVAALSASIAFGLWHVTPTINGIRMNDRGASPHKLGLATAGAVLLTTLAGLGFTWLRLRTGGLVAPIVLHAGINSVGALAAVTAASVRRSSEMSSRPR